MVTSGSRREVSRLVAQVEAPARRIPSESYAIAGRGKRSTLFLHDWERFITLLHTGSRGLTGVTAPLALSDGGAEQRRAPPLTSDGTLAVVAGQRRTVREDSGSE